MADKYRETFHISALKMLALATAKTALFALNYKISL